MGCTYGPTSIHLVAFATAEANIDGASVKLRPIFCGVKGDWPFLRKVYKLKTGFQARVQRKCHHCACPDSFQIYSTYC